MNSKRSLYVVVTVFAAVGLFAAALDVLQDSAFCGTKNSYTKSARNDVIKTLFDNLPSESIYKSKCQRLSDGLGTFF